MPIAPLRPAGCPRGLAPSSALLFLSPLLAQGQLGLRGEYFDARDPDLGEARVVQVDERLDFEWPGGVPVGATLLPDGTFSARWTGFVELPQAGAWTFATSADDGVRLTVGGQEVIDDWTGTAGTSDEGVFVAAQPGWVPIELRYLNAGGPGHLRLEFEGPGRPRTVIPPTSLCSSVECLGAADFTVDAGANRIVTPDQPTVTLAATIAGLHTSGVEGGLDVRWSQTYGPVVTLTDRDTLTPGVTPSHAGLVKLRVKVVSAVHGIAVDEVELLVFGQDQDAVVTGTPNKWDKLAFTFTHDQVLSEASTPNPFLDYRLQTLYYHPTSGTLFDVPGFFGADGNAADSGAFGGRKWITNFSPNLAGRWYYLAFFRTAPSLALSDVPTAGVPVASFNNANGSFVVAPADPGTGGFVSAGRLEYVGAHHLRYAETREPFLKGGADSPENFLAYYEFDGTFDLGGAANDLADGLHHYDAHLGDHVPRGVPTWQGDKGRRIFGAIDYLASKGVNSLYALSYNIDGGDGREVFPWANPSDKLRFDVSKLAQWERVVDHMMRAGVAWHVVTQETENDRVLDFGELGTQRKLYYRELIARFGHAGGLVWNLGEENNNTTAQRQAFAEYIHSVDPYDHPVALHNHNGNEFGTYTALLGSHLELVSLQADPATVGNATQTWVMNSGNAGRPWIVNNDEQGPANDGVVPDSVDFWHTGPRTLCLWPNLMAGGGGCEWYFGYAHPHSDLDCEDFRSRDHMWTLTRRGLDFLRQHVPFADMHSNDALQSGAFARVLAKPGEFYVVYLPQAGTPSLNLQSFVGPFQVSWFDPRNGGPLQDGAVSTITGPGYQSLGPAPAPGDWAVFVRRAQNFLPVVESVEVEIDSPELKSLSVLVHASDPNGPFDTLQVSVRAQGPDGFDETFQAMWRGGTLYSLHVPNVPPIPSGTWTFTAMVTDASGASATSAVDLPVQL